MKTLRALPVLLAAAAVVSSAAAGTSGLPQQTGGVDLATQANVVISGAVAGDLAGASVAGLGDMNGDGRDDVVVGAPSADVNARSFSGSAYVVFGRDEPGRLSLFSISAGIEAGIRIDGANAFDQAGSTVAGAGDVNGDGRPDVVVGAPAASNNMRELSGSVYVVFGWDAAGTVDLGSLGAGGFRIDGAEAYDHAGASVAGAGDVNGDGRADVVIGATYSDNNGRQLSGSAYVVFGGTSTATVDLAALGDRGFRIDGADKYDLLGNSVAGVGDLNGDSRADVLVGASSADVAGRQSAGSAYLVYGAASSTAVDVASLGDRGLRILGAAAWDSAGASVARAGDLDGDGKTDLVVGSPSADANDRFGSGSTHVIFGKALTADIDLAQLGDRGFRIDGVLAWDFSGHAVAAAGDVNDDGRGDVLVGAPYALNHGRRDAGAAFVVYGRASSASVDLSSLQGGGFRIDGAGASDSSGRSVAGAGDLNGDGRDDVLVGAPWADPLTLGQAGAAYAVYGFGDPELAYDPIEATAGKPMAPRGPRLVERTGPAAFTVSPALPAGLRLHAHSGIVSGTARAGSARRTYSVTMTDLTGSLTAPLTIAVAPDRTPPRLELSIRSPQQALRRGGILAGASCGEPCRLVAFGRIAGIGALTAARARTSGARKATLRLRLTPAVRTRLAARLEQGESARVRVTVRAVDLAGNVTVARRIVAVGG